MHEHELIGNKYQGTLQRIAQQVGKCSHLPVKFYARLCVDFDTIYIDGRWQPLLDTPPKARRVKHAARNTRAGAATR